MFNNRKKRIAKEIEAVFERFHRGKEAYAKGEFFEDEFYIRSDLASIILNRNDEILVSFADHTPPSHSALYTLLLDEIKGASLVIFSDYITDEQGSMIFEDQDLEKYWKYYMG